MDTVLRDQKQRGGRRSGAGRPVKSSRTNRTPRGKENVQSHGAATSSKAVASRRGPRKRVWRNGAKADRRKRREEYEQLRMEHEEEEEDAASQEWRALEELCHLQLRRLPSRDSLPRPQILRTSMQLNTLLVYFNARRLMSKSMAQQMAADHARVTRKTLRNWVFVFKSSAGEMLTGGQDDDDTIGCWLLESESGRKEAIAYIRQQSVSSSGEAVGKPLTVDDFHSWVNTHFIPKSLGIECHIGRTTAHTWLHALGFKYKTAKKGVFVDGHDRPDVVEFRNHSFLPKMAEVERRSFRFVPIRDEDTGAVRYEHVDGFKWGEEAGELGPFCAWQFRRMPKSRHNVYV